MKTLPYRARTEMGEIFDIAFPLHEETQDANRIEQLVSALLDAVDKDIAIAGEASNGDVLQAVAMAMAIRAGMIQASRDIAGRLACGLLENALEAVSDAPRLGLQAGHA
jgi:hypothetical protein